MSRPTFFLLQHYRLNFSKTITLNVALFAATVLLWLLLSGVVLATAASAAVMISLSLCIPIIALGGRKVCGSAGSIWFHAGVTQIIIGVTTMIGRALQLSPTTLPLILGATCIVGSILRTLPCLGTADVANENEETIVTTLISWLTFLAISVLLGSAYFVYGFWMGHGALPEYFYGVDNAFHLGLVHALIQFDALPVPSLTYSGTFLLYQYGILDAAATLVRLTEITPHTALFLVIMPLMVTALVGGCWSIFARVESPILRTCCAAMVFVATFEHWSIRWGAHLGKAILVTIREGTGTTLPLDQNFHHTATLAGIAVTLYTIWSCFVDRHFATRLFDAVLIGFLICTKSLFFITLGLWISVAAVLEAVMECRREGWHPVVLLRSLRHFIHPFVSFAVGIALQHGLGLDSGALHIAFAPLTDPYVNKNLLKLLQHALILLVPLALAIILARRAVWSANLVLAGLMFIATYFFVSLTALVWTNSGQTDFNWFQVASTTPILIGALVSSACVTGWTKISSFVSRALLVAAIIISCCSQLLRQTLMAVNTATNPTLGWEALDNRDLITALRCIPLKDSITVTNDLRSAAENYKRPYRNTQLAAIMGQHFYFSVPTYDHAQSSWLERMLEQHLLESYTWSNDIVRAAADHGWSHFLVHQSFPHPIDIPLQKVCETGAYTLYKFR